MILVPRPHIDRSNSTNKLPGEEILKQRKEVVAMSLESVPKDMRGLRACKLCSLVKVREQLLLCTKWISEYCVKMIV